MSYTKVRFENSNIASVSVEGLTQRKKLRFTVVPIGTSAAAPANQVSNDFQYVVFKVTPSDALVRLDGELLTVNGGIASKYVSAGTYTYQVECTLYHSKTGTVTVAGKKETVQIELAPAFGYINITGNSSKNGTVYIDKQKVGTAPLRSDKLPPGRHTVEIVKELYKPYSAEIVVEEGKTRELPVEMEANYAHVTFKAEEGVSIYINGQHEGKGQVVKDLTLGVYEVETRKEGCRTVKETYEITASMMDKTIPLESPIPILGSVKIESTPSDATVLIDGEEKDKTPCVLSLIIGKHTLTLKAYGYTTVNREVVVEEGKLTEVNVILNVPSFSCGTATISDYDGNTYATVKIGTQCWMKENLRATHYADGTAISQGSSSSTTVAYWYYPNNSSSNKAAYGLLYNWKAVMRNSSSSSANPSGVQGICPTGWHVPSDAEWKQMEMTVGRNQSEDDETGWRGNSAVKLSGNIGWISSSTADGPCNMSASGRNSTGFSALAAGYYDDGVHNFMFSAVFWSATDDDYSHAWKRAMFYTNVGVWRSDDRKYCGFSVRCVCDEGGKELSPITSMPSPFSCGTSTVSDYDGNTYSTVQIGTQCWMKENLRTTHYADGTSISEGDSYSTTIAYWYRSRYNYPEKYYNWKAVMRDSPSSSSNPSGVQGICPMGWHVPSDAEWKQMEMAVGMSLSDANKTGLRGTIAAKLSGNTGWHSCSDANAAGNLSAYGRNSSGFSAIPQGTCNYTGELLVHDIFFTPPYLIVSH